MSPLTPEQQERIAKDMAANRARQAALTRQQRIEAGEFSLDLVRTAADPPENDWGRIGTRFHYTDSRARAGVGQIETGVRMRPPLAGCYFQWTSSTRRHLPWRSCRPANHPGTSASARRLE